MLFCESNEATKRLVPGAYWKAYHVEVGELMTAELLALGLLDKADVQNQTDKNPAYKKYFMHGTSHHLGLDTHDYGLLDQPINANMVFTVEPGIYVPKRGLAFGWKTMWWYNKQANPNLMKTFQSRLRKLKR